MAEGLYHCALCPHLPVTPTGLVRHIGMSHSTISLVELNTAFAGVKVFVKCKYCPGRYLAAGVNGHEQSMHKEEKRQDLQQQRDAEDRLEGFMPGRDDDPSQGVENHRTAREAREEARAEEESPQFTPAQLAARQLARDVKLANSTGSFQRQVAAFRSARETNPIIPPARGAPLPARGATPLPSRGATPLPSRGATPLPARGALNTGLLGRAMRAGAPQRARAVPPGVPTEPLPVMGALVQVEEQVPFPIPRVAEPPHELVDDLLVHDSPWIYGEHGEHGDEIAPGLGAEENAEGIGVAEGIGDAAGDAEGGGVAVDVGEDEGEHPGVLAGDGVIAGGMAEAGEDYGTLVGHFHRGAYYKHYTWRVLLRPITLSLLGDCVSENENVASRGIAALQLLPGLVVHCRGQRKKKVWTPIQLLREIEGAPDRAIEIIRIARSWIPQLRT